VGRASLSATHGVRALVDFGAVVEAHDEHGAAIGFGAEGRGCLLTSSDLEGHPDWQIAFFATLAVVPSALTIAPDGTTWLSCNLSDRTADASVDGGGITVIVPAGGSILAHVAGDGALLHLEASASTATNVVAWPDGRVAIVRGPPAHIEWRDADGTSTQSLALTGLHPIGAQAIDIVPVNDTDDDVIISVFGDNDPSAVEFESGEVSPGGAYSRTIMARVRPTGVVWAAAMVEGASFDGVFNIGRAGDRVVVAGHADTGALQNIITGETVFAFDATTWAGFVGHVDIDGTASGVTFLPEGVLASSPSGDDVITWAVLSEPMDLNFDEDTASLLRVTAMGAERSPLLEPIEGGAVDARSVSAVGDVLVLAARTLVTTTDLTPLVPDATAGPVSGVLVLRPSVAWVDP
jgi:hypothetical protein